MNARASSPARIRPVIPPHRDEYYREVAALRAEVADLRETVRQYKALLHPPLCLPACLRLTPSEGRLLAALHAHKTGLSKEALHAALSGGIEADSDIKIVDVYVCKLRGKLARHGIGIETIWSQGYRLSAAGRAALASLMEAAA
jgi:DNA-binding response OmpR family regulator